MRIFLKILGIASRVFLKVVLRDSVTKIHPSTHHALLVLCSLTQKPPDYLSARRSGRTNLTLGDSGSMLSTLSSWSPIVYEVYIGDYEDKIFDLVGDMGVKPQGTTRRFFAPSSNRGLRIIHCKLFFISIFARPPPLRFSLYALVGGYIHICI